MNSTVLETPTEVVLDPQVNLDEVVGDQSTVQQDDLNTPVIALVGFVSAILTFVSIFALQGLYNQYAQALEQSKVVNVRLEEAERTLDSQRAKLSSFSMINKEKGIVALPIEQAMQLVLEDLKK